MTIKETFYLYYNECSTKPAMEVYVPLGFFKYSGKDYNVTIITGLEFPENVLVSNFKYFFPCIT